MKQQGATLVQRACAKVAGFKTLHKKLEKKIVVSGRSQSTLSNYMRCIAHVALYYKCLPRSWIPNRSRTIEYLGRYTHKIAISNHRIISITDEKVCFRYKDYRDAGNVKIMALDPMEFVRRFALHILPKGFVRIRHYGILSSRRKQKTLPLIHQQLDSVYQKSESTDWKQICIQHLNYNPDCCPVCNKQTMVTILVFDKRGPPEAELIQSRIRLQKLQQA